MREIRIGVIYKNNVIWTGRDQYFRNLFAATRAPFLETDIQYILLKSPSVKNVSPILLPIVNEILEIPSPLPAPGFWKHQRNRFLKRLGLWREPPSSFGIFLRLHDINCIFSDVDMGHDFRIPTISWIPDFQHIHFPGLFTEDELNHRNRLFKKMAINSSLVVLSSQDAKRDFEQFLPDHVAKVHVLSFVSQLPENVYREDPAEICKQYHLPSRFIYLPNQFWMHKNHEMVLDALKLLNNSHPEITIVCTGNTNEYRNPAYFGQILAKIALEGLRERMILLGLIPYKDIFQLMRQSLAVLQPSKFEGWSTTVEEVKSLGKSILLSDIPVHREQNPPGAIYFDPYKPDALAHSLIEIYQTCLPGPDTAMESIARETLPGRTQEFAGQFARILDKLVE